MRIAIDAMGGDYAPEAVVLGVIEALDVVGDRCKLVLVGDEERIKQILDKHGVGHDKRPEIVHAPEVVGMDESPSISLKRKKRSSIAVCASLAKSGEVDALVSAGNTGAVVAATKLRLRFLRGVERPAIATPIPTPKGITVMLDAGANVDSKPYNLLQFAGMGACYSKLIFGIENPKIGILSIGEEEGKGNELTKETFNLLKNSGLNFIGNVEGRDIFTHKADVVVTDGFVGNVVLKVTEGVHRTFKTMLKEAISKSILSKLGGLLIAPAFKDVTRRGDYEEYGGAPLLGVDGISIICHGSSSPKAIKNAVRIAHELGQIEVNRHIEDLMDRLKVLKNNNNTF
ncbi:MAG: phosphate acyltransferase PlsX [Candidatus Auribacter fodinae]|jgi:glycerol-3-phosphate acyltransferase PlsX|uniref:Phosphate acyltransferase n=1 Tax=Candidatus Auribacter fodinae TaxID=2093366 RepID=A0A3A4QUS0_9BACT|nr:MAG: phosphate acyltransferase PlsX [Candidatus Auribacter fodinae]